MTAIKINIEIPHDRYSEIEEYCVNKAISINQYFIALHELNQIHNIFQIHETDERMKQFTQGFAYRKEESEIKESLTEHDNLINSKKSKKKS